MEHKNHKNLPILQRAAAFAAGLDIGETFALSEQIDAAHDEAILEHARRQREPEYRAFRPRFLSPEEAAQVQAETRHAFARVERRQAGDRRRF